MDFNTFYALLCSKIEKHVDFIVWSLVYMAFVLYFCLDSEIGLFYFCRKFGTSFKWLQSREHKLHQRMHLLVVHSCPKGRARMQPRNPAPREHYMCWKNDIPIENACSEPNGPISTQ